VIELSSRGGEEYTDPAIGHDDDGLPGVGVIDEHPEALDKLGQHWGRRKRVVFNVAESHSSFLFYSIWECDNRPWYCGFCAVKTAASAAPADHDREHDLRRLSPRDRARFEQAHRERQQALERARWKAPPHLQNETIQLSAGGWDGFACKRLVINPPLF
jgi:hypothetical protein